MWLLNTETYELRNFVSAEATPKYAILSHCWRDGEVSFADIQDLLVAKTRHGWPKIANACQYAKDVHLHAWIWIDTCCIDKASSAELSEAINSMFAWYRDAAVCIVYMDDVPAGTDPQAAQSAFRESRWFTRGWTLQELIAPSQEVVFLAGDWTFLASRDALALSLEEITGIDAVLLRAPNAHKSISPTNDLDRKDRKLRFTSVAKRMSWAAGRQTTRPEDRAYSLMGIFEVVIPVMYGEGGASAFRRLQLEILRGSNDQSLFAWGVQMSKPLSRYIQSGVATDLKPRGGKVYITSLLAESPSDFASSSNLSPDSYLLSDLTRYLKIPPILEPHYFDTNYGIRIRVPLLRIPVWILSSTFYCAALSCRTEGQGPRRWIVLLLARRGSTEVYNCLSFDSEDPSRPVGDPSYNNVRPAWLSSTGAAPSVPRPGLRGLFGQSNRWKAKTIYIATTPVSRDRFASDFIMGQLNMVLSANRI